ncbi:MAG: hypothetical protein FWD61_10720 [Phycisphaerales bacterium]|nr:hypothetical protein [Phycisphaerales bacterium]
MASKIENRKSKIENLFERSASIDGNSPIDTRTDWKQVPAKPAVYLITGPAPSPATDNPEHPFLLATVGNLRAALQRRLADDPPELLTKRIQYGQVCTRVHWRIVHSPFSANFHYCSAARTLFPDTYKTMIGWGGGRNTWWLALDLSDSFPDFRRTQDISDSRFRYAGPIRDKSAAGKLIEILQDLFDLCRHHAILVQAPHGKACAYKEMGKCPAPCDGSTPISWYHSQINRAFDFAANIGNTREAWRQETESAMKSAAANLQFEQAGRIKQRLIRAAFLDVEPLAYLSSLDNFTWLALQPGQGKPYLEPWLIHPWHEGGTAPIERLPQFKKKDLATAAQALFAHCQSLKNLPTTTALTASVAEQLSLLAHHLFKGEADPGLYLRLRDIASPADILNAATKLFARKSPPKPVQEQSSDKPTDIPATTESLPPAPNT